MESERRDSRQGGERNMVYKPLQMILRGRGKIVKTATPIGDIHLDQLSKFGTFGALLAFSVSACEASQMDVGGANAGQQSVAIQQAADNKTGTAVANQQLPINQRFRNLDEYLAYLERMQAPVDGAWYKQIGPGLYELQTGNLRTLTPDEGKRTFTREELEKQFGFTK